MEKQQVYLTMHPLRYARVRISCNGYEICKCYEPCIGYEHRRFYFGFDFYCNYHSSGIIFSKVGCEYFLLNFCMLYLLFDLFRKNRLFFFRIGLYSCLPCFLAVSYYFRILSNTDRIPKNNLRRELIFAIFKNQSYRNTRFDEIPSNSTPPDEHLLIMLSLLIPCHTPKAILQRIPKQTISRIFKFLANYQFS